MKFPYQQAKLHVLEAGHYPCHSRLCTSDCESFLQSKAPDIFAFCYTNLEDSVDSSSNLEELSSF